MLCEYSELATPVQLTLKSDDFSPPSESDVLRQFKFLCDKSQQSVIMPSFKYLIFIDFEATCWGGYRLRQEDAEIIGTELFLFIF